MYAHSRHPAWVARVFPTSRSRPQGWFRRHSPIGPRKDKKYLMFKALRDGNREVLVSGKIHIILLGGEEAEALTCCHLLLLLLRALVSHPGTNFEDKPCTSTKPRRGRHIYRIGC